MLARRFGAARSGDRDRTARTVLVVAALATAVACGPAGATTVGGSTQSTNGSFVLAGGRIAVPTYVADDPGMASGGPPGCCTTSTSGVLSFGAANHNWSQLLDLSDSGNGSPVLASSGKSV